VSFNADKKREHESSAEKALVEKNYAKAFFHTAKAAEFGLNLADQTEGKVAIRHLEDAMELIEIADELKKKVAPKAAPSKKSSAVADDEQQSASSNEWVVREKPSVRLSDIAGMHDVKAKLDDMVLVPLQHAEEAKEWGIKSGGGILLYGPPGTGKTTLGKAVAAELDAPFFYATGAQIRSKWHGESEQRLRDLIQSARSEKVSVLFLDDVDGLLPKRSGNSVVDNRIVVQFLAEIGGFQDSANTLLILGATNLPWEIDEAVFRTGRFDEKIYVGLPDIEAREFLIRKNIGNAPVAEGLDIRKLADRLDGYTGSDLVAIVMSAKRAGFRRTINGGGKPTLTIEDIDSAVRTIPASVTPALIKKYEDFAKLRFS